MLFLFILLLLSTGMFSLYLYLEQIVQNPLIYVLIGWGCVVIAHYFSYWFDKLKIVVLNRSFQAFIVNGEGEYWTGEKFSNDGNDNGPYFVYNDLQVSELVKRVIELTNNNDLYVRIMPQEDIEEM